MALARLVTFVPLTLIKSADVNGEFNNILNNPVALISPSTGAINFNLQPHTNLLPGTITGTSGVAFQSLIVSTSGGAVWGPSGTGAAGSRVKGLNGTLTSQTGTFAADQYVLQSTTGNASFVMNSTASFVVSIATAGPSVNGRDVAGAFSSTEVHWYAISTGAGSTTPAGIVSTQLPAAGPVMPTSYSAYAYLGGSVYTSVSTQVSNTHRFHGALATYDAVVAILSGVTTTSEVAFTTRNALPSNALSYNSEEVMAYQYNGAANQTWSSPIRPVSGLNWATPTRTVQTNASNQQYNEYYQLVDIPNVSNQLSVLLTGTSSFTAVNLTISANGYRMPNGDA